jgi:hypothetical protein
MPSKYFVKLCFILCLLLLVVGVANAAKPIPQVRILRQTTPVLKSPGSAPAMLRTGDSCTVYHGGDPFYYIYPWIIGDELLKSFQDPSLTCEQPYPFLIEYVHLPLVYLDTGTIYVSVDIEDVDWSDPSCPKPGSLFTISSLYEITLEENFYLISIPLDTPIAVNGPYFAGAYIAPDGYPGAAAIVTDTIPVPCVGYNDWGEGFVDLDTVHNVNDGSKIFPGRFLMYSSGITGGTGGPDPDPIAQFIYPENGQFLGSSVDLWANDIAGSRSIARVDFQYFNGSSWIHIGSDMADDPPLRNGVTPSGSGRGLSYTWNTTDLAEGNYQVRAVISDISGIADTATISLHIDPTPHFPVFQQPFLGQNICNGISISVACPDEDLAFMSFYNKTVAESFTLLIPIINQQFGGDADGDPTDGNPALQGEFGDYCSGPSAAAMAIKYWFDQGYKRILQDGSANVLTDFQLMDELFIGMHVEDNLGTFDGEFVTGLRDYIELHGGNFDLAISRDPSVSELFNWTRSDEHIVMVGLSGDPGLWMTVAGSVNLTDNNGHYKFKMVSPISADIASYTVKEDVDGVWVLYDFDWTRVDIMVGLIPNDWTVTRSAIGVDAVGSDGWSIFWDTDALSEDSLHIISVTSSDLGSHTAEKSVLAQKDCSMTAMPGDLDYDQNVTPADLVYMINFLYLGGPPPIGGYITADVNCDDLINLADLIYLHKYVMMSGPPPCP